MKIRFRLRKLVENGIVYWGILASNKNGIIIHGQYCILERELERGYGLRSYAAQRLRALRHQLRDTLAETPLGSALASPHV